MYMYIIYCTVENIIDKGINFGDWWLKKLPTTIFKILPMNVFMPNNTWLQNCQSF